MVRRTKRLPKADMVIIEAERRNVEEGEIRPTLANLNGLLEADNARDYFERVEFCIQGYDHDPRELCEIAEVREWMARLDKAFPYWFLILNKQSQSLGFVTFSLCPIVKTDEGGIFLDPRGLQDFMLRRFAAVNRLVDQGVLTEGDNLVISIHVSDYYRSQTRSAE